MSENKERVSTEKKNMQNLPVESTCREEQVISLTWPFLCYCWIEKGLTFVQHTSGQRKSKDIQLLFKLSFYKVLQAYINFH